MQLDISFKRIDPSLPVPSYQTPGSVAFDLYARTDTKIASQSLGLIPANICVQIPAGFTLLVCSRSSTPKKKGLLKPHGLGIIDQDYCGNNDEIQIQMYNFTEQSVLIKKGERIAQALIVPILRGELCEVQDMPSADRGGFGSTDQ